MKNNWLRVGIPVLFTILLVGGVLGSVGAIPSNDKADRAKKLAKKIEGDLKNTEKYSEKDMDELVKLLEDISGVRLNNEQKKMAKDYTIKDMKKKIKLEKLKKKAVPVESARVKKTFSESGTAFQVISSSVPSITFKQPLVDITGGFGTDDAGYPYIINGDNDLYGVEVSTVYLDPFETSCPSGNYWMYILHYYDEDHPNPTLDQYYDTYRLIRYGRIEDEEAFYVGIINDMICFDEIWSNDKTFAYPVGQHGSATFSYSPTIYIAVWNHAMDVNDDNPKLQKADMP